MRGRPWIIKPSLLADIGIAVAAYVALVETFDVGPFGPRVPGTSVSAHGLREYAFAWSIACSAVGWLQFVRKRRPPRAAALWPVAVVPLAIAVGLAVADAWHAWGEYGRYRNFLLTRGIPHASFSWSWGLSLLGAAMSLAYGVMLSAFLAAQGVVWRLPVTPGVCTACGYDLTGNTSGTCPECGTRIVEDQSIPARFYRRKQRWLPELALFPDAQIRYDAWRQAYRERSHSWALYIFLAGVLTALIARALMAAGHEAIGWLTLAAAVAITGGALGVSRRGMRQALRRQLRALGLCAKCGAKLVDARCSECGTSTTANAA